MNEVGASSDGVFVTGDWMDDAGLGGEWQEPGSNASAQLDDSDGDGLYTLTLTLAPKIINTNMQMVTGGQMEKLAEMVITTKRTYLAVVASTIVSAAGIEP